MCHKDLSRPGEQHIFSRATMLIFPGLNCQMTLSWATKTGVTSIALHPYSKKETIVIPLMVNNTGNRVTERCDIRIESSG